jgi:hypothetical protein
MWFFGCMQPELFCVQLRVVKSRDTTGETSLSSWLRCAGLLPACGAFAAGLSQPVRFGRNALIAFQFGVKPNVVQRRIRRMSFAVSNDVARCNVQRLSQMAHSLGLH